MRLTAGNSDNKVSVGCVYDAKRWKRYMCILRISHDINYPYKFGLGEEKV